MQDFFYTLVFMKVSINHFLVLFFSICLGACSISEDYTFNPDFSGHYSFNFDYSAILQFDSSGTANDEMEKGYLEMEEELKKIEGITNILIVSNGEKGKVLVSYDFANLEALNQTNYDAETGKYSKYFSKEGKKFEFTADFSEELKEYTDPNMSVEELKENIQTMLEYTINFTFEDKIKVIDARNIEQKDDYSLSYTLNEQGLSSSSNFTVKIR